MSTSGAAIHAEGLEFAYPGGPDVLAGLTLRVEPGERVAILGPNGSGKTTFALHLNGLLEPRAGEVAVGGLPVTADNLAEVRRRVGMVFQDPDDQLFMPTVHDDVAFGPANTGTPPEDLPGVVAQALEAVGAADLADRVPHHLSAGEKRRAALATVLSMQPDVLVLDEPTSHLDPVGRRRLADLLVHLAGTQLVVTHDLPFALATCPRAVVVGDGRVLADAPTAELLADHDLLDRYGLGGLLGRLA